MRKADIRIGHAYLVSVPAGRHNTCVVRITGKVDGGGWYGHNVRNGRRVVIESSRRIRYEMRHGDGQVWEPVEG